MLIVCLNIVCCVERVCSNGTNTPTQLVNKVYFYKFNHFKYDNHMFKKIVAVQLSTKLNLMLSTVFYKTHLNTFLNSCISGDVKVVEEMLKKTIFLQRTSMIKKIFLSIIILCTVQDLQD